MFGFWDRTWWWLGLTPDPLLRVYFWYCSRDHLGCQGLAPCKTSSFPTVLSPHPLCLLTANEKFSWILLSIWKCSEVKTIISKMILASTSYSPFWCLKATISSVLKTGWECNWSLTDLKAFPKSGRQNKRKCYVEFGVPMLTLEWSHLSLWYISYDFREYFKNSTCVHYDLFMITKYTGLFFIPLSNHKVYKEGLFSCFHIWCFA